MLKFLAVFLPTLFILYGCSDTGEKNEFIGKTVDFKNPHVIKSSEIIAGSNYVKLESTEASLIGELSQVETFQGRIYILDTYKTGTLFVFSKTGVLLSKLEKKGNGPGEFIFPHSFKIDSQGYLYVLDRTLNRLLKYKANDLTFIEEVKLPILSPLS